MLKRVLVGFDGSQLAREAFAYAVVLAKAARAQVLGVHAVEPIIAPALGGDPSILLDPMVPPVILATGDDESVKEERARAEVQLKELGDSAAKAGVPYSSRIEVGSVVDVLSGLAGPDDLIAVGLKGRFKQTGMGSSTRWFVSHAPCPVLVASGPLQPINHVLVAYDGATVSTRAVEFARDLARAAGWPLTILALARGHFKLGEALDWSQELAPGAQVIAQGPGDRGEAQLIERVAAKDPYALMVMGAYADSWFKDLFTGSTTGHVLAHLKGPIILVHGR